MDLFEIPDDYKPQKPLTMEQMDEITNYLKGHPLFLKEIPEDISNNEHLLALQALIEEQDPAITAQNLNKQANARLAQGPNSPYYLKDAYQKYTKAIALNCTNPQLNAKLRANRAAINLKFKNYGKVIEDCKVAIQLAPEYLKAYYRMGRALIALGKHAQCVALLEPHSDENLVAMRKQAEVLITKEKAQQAQKSQKKNQYEAQVEAYFQQRQWKLGKQSQHLPEGVSIRFVEGRISIPLIVIYPEFGQFDLIANTQEQQRISQCLLQLLQAPLPWDTKQEYKPNTVQAYLQLEEGVLLRLPPQATISELAARRPVNGAIEILLTTNNAFAHHYAQQHKIY